MNLPHRLLLPAALAAALASAQAASVTGRITDDRNQLALSGARVSIAGTSIESYADATGHYRIDDLPEGTYQLRISYVGLPEEILSLVVADTPVVRDVVLNRAVQLEAMVISDRAVGSARAINQQRAAETLSHIIAADAIGRFPDQNAAESLQRVPGLSLYRDQGEGRFIVIRGIRPDLNSVQLNGVSVASPELGSRTMALDVLPSDALGSVEVTKVPTPDQPADGIGGIVNMKTRSAFDHEGRQIDATGQFQYNSLAGSYSPKFNATYSDFFRDGTLGFIVAPSWQRRSFGSNNFEEDGGWSLVNVPGGTTQEYFFNGLAFRQYEIVRTRTGLNSALEYKPDDERYFYLRGTWSQFTDKENRYITYLPFSEGTVSALSSTSATVTGMRRERHDLRYREKAQEMGSVVAGADFRLADWNLKTEVAYSEGVERRPDELSFRWRKSARGSTWSYSFADGIYAPSVTQSAGPNLADLANRASFNETSRLRLVNAPGRETERAARIDARRDFNLPGDMRGFLKTGGLARWKDKGSNNETLEYSSGNTLPSSLSYATLAEIQPNYPFFGGTRANATLAAANFAAARGSLTPTRLLAESTNDDWQSSEDVMALYAHAGVDRGPLQVSAGVRWEQTDFSNQGFELVDGTTVRAVEASRKYDNWLPGVYSRYRLGERTQLRASVSTALSRPAFEESALRRAVNTTTTPDRITQGNPNLKALEATSYDLSLEHYLGSLGMVSIGAFQKDIKNFTYQTVIPSTGADIPEVTTYVNGLSGDIRGIELAWEQKLTFLPAPFNGFGVHANYTTTESSADYTRVAGGPTESLDFIGQSKEVANVALSYERGPLFLRVALNHRSPRLREDEPIGPSAAEDRYVDSFTQIDLTGSYRFTRNLELFAEVLNLTNEPFRVYFQSGNQKRLTQFEEYGWSTNVGVRWKL